MALLHAQFAHEILQCLALGHRLRGAQCGIERCPESRFLRIQRPPRDHHLRAVALAETPALRMRIELELLDPVPRIPVRHLCALSAKSKDPNLTLMLSSSSYLAGPARRPFTSGATENE